MDEVKVKIMPWNSSLAEFYWYRQRDYHVVGEREIVDVFKASDASYTLAFNHRVCTILEAEKRAKLAELCAELVRDSGRTLKIDDRDAECGLLYINFNPLVGSSRFQVVDGAIEELKKLILDSVDFTKFEK